MRKRIKQRIITSITILQYDINKQKKTSFNEFQRISVRFSLSFREFLGVSQGFTEFSGVFREFQRI